LGAIALVFDKGVAGEKNEVDRECSGGEGEKDRLEATQAEAAERSDHGRAPKRRSAPAEGVVIVTAVDVVAVMLAVEVMAVVGGGLPGMTGTWPAPGRTWMTMVKA
jgi:hypothetical protein